MVSLSERDAIACRAKTDGEMRGVYAFLFGETFDYAAASSFPHATLLRAVAERDQNGFHEQVMEFQRRRTSEGSGWYDNDSLLFLLLVGCERFQVDPSCLDGILAARDRNANPVPKRVNEIFRALARKEYRMEGQFSFIKIPILFLANRLTLYNEGAQRAYNELSRPGLLAELSPFLQLLALRAYDLVLFHRQPQIYENFDALVLGVEGLKEKASLRQVAKLLWALPYKWVFAVILIILPFAFGVGQKALALWHEPSSICIRPKAIDVASGTDAMSHALTGVRALAQQSVNGQQLGAGDHLTVVAVETTRLQNPTPKFSVEALAGMADITDAYAVLVQPGDGGPSQTILPVKYDSRSIRTFLPPSESDSYLVFVILFRQPSKLDPHQVAAAISLRTLD